MKNLVLLLILVLSFFNSAWAGPTKVSALPVMPHLDLEMTGNDYLSLLQTARRGVLPTSELQVILDVGKRNLDWLRYINDARDAAHKISFSSAATQTGIPMGKPRQYNPPIIQSAYNALILTLPVTFKAVVIDGQALTQNPPMIDDEYLKWGRAIDSSYQMAARWETMKPYLGALVQRKVLDIRGYYFLSQMINVKEKLDGWLSLDAAIQKLFTEYLVEMCLNNGEGSCTQVVTDAVQINNVFALYSRYFSASKETFDNYFLIAQQRSDVTWKNGAQNAVDEMHVPFTDPNSATVQNFLTNNIQDEWRLSNWQLLLDFGAAATGKPQVVFEAGVTPHVEVLAGNTITMDANQPLTEYNVQWTIRHEFGHVLGFPDCYLEFYDSGTNIITSYQLDITNIMCSRKGHIQDLHYNELKRVYGSNP
jgi:hypothetical protein